MICFEQKKEQVPRWLNNSDVKDLTSIPYNFFISKTIISPNKSIPHWLTVTIRNYAVQNIKHLVFKEIANKTSRTATTKIIKKINNVKSTYKEGMHLSSLQRQFSIIAKFDLSSQKYLA